MRIIALIITLSFFFVIHSGAKGKPELTGSTEGFIWTEFDILPPSSGVEIQPGLAGAFSGIIDLNLIIAGGANFPGDPPWKGGVKQWHRDIYIRSLDSAYKDWKIFQDILPHPLAYGYSVSLPQGVLCIGGCNDKYISGEVFLIKFINDSVSFEAWPSLPVPLAYMAGAFIDGKIYIAGGQEEIKRGAATNHFFALDLQNVAGGWESLSSWPGPPRAFAVATGQSDGFDNCFYLFSGRNFGPDHPVEVLNDGYAYNPRMNTWKKLDTPEGPLFPVMAGTAVSGGANHIIFFGGSDGKIMMEEYQIRKQLEEYSKQHGKLVNEDTVSILQQQIAVMQDNHPGFSRDIRLFHTITNTVIIHSVAPIPLPVTTNIIKTGNRFMITGGEIRPGIRTPMILSAEITTPEKTFGFLNSAVIFIYFVVLVIMGWYFSRKQKNANDYFRAGGRLPWWAVGLSIFGTALSAITFMSIPAKAYATDWSYILFNAGIVVVAPVIIILFIPFYRKLNITTAYEYLEQRFNTATRVITSISYIFFQIGRMGIVLFLPSIALNVVTGIDIFLCITLMGVFSLIYTMMGGIEAVVWTDALQVVVLLGGAILAVILISLDVKGGFTGIIAMGASDGKFSLPNVNPDLTNPTLITVLIATLFTNLTTYGTDQTIVQRYLTTSTEKMAAKSVWTNALLTIPASLIFFFVGTALYVYFKENPVMLSSTITDQDAIFPWYIFTQMPPGVSGLLIAGIFAAAMSTLSASMNSSATAYMVDIHFRFGWSKDMKGLKLPRIATLVLGLAGISFAFMMATLDIKSLWDEFNKILGLILGSLGGLFLLGMLTRKANGAGALIGIFTSILVQIWVGKTQAVHLLLFAASGFISCFIAGYIASLFFPSFNKKTDHLTIYRNKN